MAFVEVVESTDGKFIVKTTGDNGRQDAEGFPTRSEAEEWLIRSGSLGKAGKIYKPGDGQGVA